MKLLQRYTINQYIYQSDICNVIKCHDEILDKDVAVKEIFEEFCSVDDFNNECTMIKMFECENSVKFLDSFKHCHCFYIVMEYYEETLFDSIICKGSISENECLKKFSKLIKVLINMHMNGYAHCDIKLENILIKNGDLVLADYGQSINFKSTIPACKRIGTSSYCPPEILKGDKFDENVDVYALGVTLYACLTGQFPFYGSNQYEYEINVIRSDPDIQQLKNNNVSNDTVQMIEKMLNKSSKNRPTIRDIEKCISTI